MPRVKYENPAREANQKGLEFTGRRSSKTHEPNFYNRPILYRLIISHLVRASWSDGRVRQGKCIAPFHSAEPYQCSFPTQQLSAIFLSALVREAFGCPLLPTPLSGPTAALWPLDDIWIVHDSFEVPNVADVKILLMLRCNLRNSPAPRRLE